MTYFNNMWTLPCPLTLMQGVGSPSMVMPLSVVEVGYSIVQQTSINYYPTPPQEIYIVLESIWAQESLTSHDPL